MAPGSRVIVTGIYSTFNVGKNVSSCLVSAYGGAQVDYRKTLRERWLFDSLTYGYYISSKTPRFPARTGHLAHSLPPRKRRNLLRWLEAQVSMSGLRTVLHLASTVA